MNEDLYILQYKQNLQDNLQKAGLSLNQRPILEISGAIVGRRCKLLITLPTLKTTGILI